MQFDINFTKSGTIFTCLTIFALPHCRQKKNVYMHQETHTEYSYCVKPVWYHWHKYFYFLILPH